VTCSSGTVTACSCSWDSPSMGLLRGCRGSCLCFRVGRRVLTGP